MLSSEGDDERAGKRKAHQVGSRDLELVKHLQQLRAPERHPVLGLGQSIAQAHVEAIPDDDLPTVFRCQ